MPDHRQRWIDKATVQAAIVNAIPVTFTAIIAVLSILATNRNSSKQLLLVERQYLKDSINSSLEKELILKQINIANRNYFMDSITGFRQLEIAKIQLNQILIESKTKQNIYRIRLSKTILDIFESTPIQGLIYVKYLTLNERILLVNRLDSLLNSESNNPFLINNKQELDLWLKAQDDVRSMHNKQNLDFMVKENRIFELLITNVWDKVFKVWINLYFDSAAKESLKTKKTLE